MRCPISNGCLNIRVAFLTRSEFPTVHRLRKSLICQTKLASSLAILKENLEEASCELVYYDLLFRDSRYIHLPPELQCYQNPQPFQSIS
jgi:hypothetical protein